MRSSRPAAVESTTLLTLDASAYGNALTLDEHAVYLLTSSAAYRLSPGQPPQRRKLDLGIGPTLTRSHIVYWSNGAVRRVPKDGGEPEVVAEVAHQPQLLAASGERFVWLDRSDAGRFRIVTVRERKPRLVHAPEGRVAALTMLDDRAYFVEQSTDGRWRIGGVTLGGGEPTFTQARAGRTPSMLAAADELYFYDGPTFTVRRLARDVAREQIVLRDFICSPIAASERIFCAQVGGLYQIEKEAPTPRPLPRKHQGIITAIAASPSRVAWLVDAGQDRLAVETLALPFPGPQGVAP